MFKYIIFSLSILFLLACEQESREGGEKNNQDTTIDNNGQSEKPDKNENNINLRTYTNDEFNFKLQYPSGWRITENNIGGNFPVINLYPSQYDGILDIPANVHAPAEVTYISIFPKGYGTELPSGESIVLSETELALDLDFNLNRQETTLFQLENGDTWSYMLVAENAATSWQNGFIFAQINTNNFSATCYQKNTGEEIPMEDCDPMTGDRIVRRGEKDQESAAEMEAILESFQFTNEQNEKPNVTELIEIEQPLPNQDITSPLTIRGQAKGMWYFEGDFPVELVDKDGNTLSEGIATAQGQWMTEDFVPFTATIQYDSPPDDERGYLIFHRSNASGLPENDMEYRLPVIFPPR